MHIHLPPPVYTAISLLCAAGFEAYAVGGCVRDTLLSKQPGDWDITTAARPEEILEIFAKYRTIPTGLQHGTVTVLVADMPLEITTYRVDGAYSDNRHPDAVTFTASLQEDLRRRDFTVNALAYHPDKGLVDIFGGVEDLRAGRIACVGDPEARFCEDALRILRALRFSSVLGFSIEEHTARALHRLSPLLHRVSVERIAVELKKLLVGQDVRQVLLDYADVLCEILPELQPTRTQQQNHPYHYLPVYEHTVETVAAVRCDPLLRLTMLFHDVGKPACHTVDDSGIDHFYGHASVSAAIAEQALRRLKMDKGTIDMITRLVAHHGDPLTAEKPRLTRLLNRMGTAAHLLVEVQHADVCGQHPDKRERLVQLDAVQEQLTALEQERACFSLLDLAVKGDDLLDLGYPAGKRLGDTLQLLLEAVMDGQCPNEKDTLLKIAKDRL